MEIKKMFEDLYRIWKKTGILKRRGAKLSRLWRRNGRKIKGIWKTRGTKLRRMHCNKSSELEKCANFKKFSESAKGLLQESTDIYHLNEMNLSMGSHSFDVNRWIQCFEQLGVINGR